eukprot:scaffold3193_cov73-Skeletonema_dohrnii-CCMP3373.AAC.2
MATEAVYCCSSHSVRYEMVRESCIRPSQIGPHQLEPCKISFYTIVTNQNGPLAAVDCDNHSDRYPGGRETPVEPVKSTRAKQGGANYDFKGKNLFSIQSKAKASANRRFSQAGVSLPPGYDMMLECCWRPPKLDLIRSPTTL